MPAARFSVMVANRGTPLVFDVATTAIDSTITALRVPATGWTQYNGVGTSTPNPASGAAIQSAAGTHFQFIKWETVP